MTPRAYSYLRFSTSEQQQGDSYRRQTSLAQEYARQRGLELDDELTFHDLGISGWQGKNFQAGRLGAFLELVRAGDIERGSYLLVEGLDRLSRMTPLDALNVLNQICTAGITVVTLSGMSGAHEYTRESLNDPTTLLGSVIEFIRANQESEWKSRRLKAAWENKRAGLSERKMTGKCPAWLRLDPRTGKFVIMRERAAIVKRIFRETLKGYGQHKIAERLNHGAVPVFGRGQHWHRSYIVKMLSNDAVIGTLTPHTLDYREGKRMRTPLDKVPGYYPAVIDATTFRRVQAMRSGTRTPLRGRHAQGEVRNIFGGLAVCGLCGATMTRLNKGDSPKGGAYLVCSRARTGAGCQYRTIRYPDVEHVFLTHAPRLLATAPTEGTRGEAIDIELENIDVLLSVLDDTQENLLQAIGRGRSTALAARLHHVEAERAELEARRVQLFEEQAQASSAIVRAKLKELRRVLEESPLDRRLVNSLLRQLFSKVVIDRAEGAMVFHWRHGGESDMLFRWPDEDEPDTRRKKHQPRTGRP